MDENETKKKPPKVYYELIIAPSDPSETASADVHLRLQELVNTASQLNMRVVRLRELTPLSPGENPIGQSSTDGAFKTPARKRHPATGPGRI